MSDCGCDKARQDLEEYLRNEVCKTEARDIRQHLENCPGCQDEALVARTQGPLAQPETVPFFDNRGDEPRFVQLS